MKNILTTIPRSKFKTWDDCEKILKKCDGEDKKIRRAMFWLINTNNLPKKSEIGNLCYMVFDGMIRGYFDIVDFDESENWREKHGIGKKRNTKCIVMANWHPIKPVPYVGFQGWRYTEMRP